MINCPNFNAFLVAFPGTIVRRIAELPVLVHLQGSQLLLDQAIAGLASRVSGFAIRGGAPTVAPRSFLDRYSELPAASIASLLFAMVLPSPGALVIQLKGGGHHVPPPVRHGSLSSCPNPIGVDVALSACPLLRYGGQGLIPYNLVPQYVRSPLASRVDYNYGGFFRAAPPPTKYFNYYHPHNGHPSHHGGHPSAQASSSVYGGCPATLRNVPSFVYGGGTTFPRVMGDILVRLHRLPRASALQARRFTLLCCRAITIPLLAQTSRRLIPALVKAYLLLSHTIPGSPESFHLLPHPVLLLPLPLLQRSSSSIPSRMLRLTWMHWGSSSFIFRIPISLPVSPMVPLSRPLPTARPVVFGKVSSDSQ